MNRKMLVRAFAKTAKEYSDSKKSKYYISRYGYNSARQYVRLWSVDYDDEMLMPYADYLGIPIIQWGQAEYDCFVEEEFSCM